MSAQKQLSLATRGIRGFETLTIVEKTYISQNISLDELDIEATIVNTINVDSVEVISTSVASLEEVSVEVGSIIT